MNLTPLAISWAVVAIAVAALAAYRRFFVAQDEDENIHVMDAEVPMIAKQTVVARKLDAVDRWGKTLTVFAAAYGLVLLVLWAYQVWNASNTLRMGN
jgi:hypothetical protein